MRRIARARCPRPQGPVRGRIRSQPPGGPLSTAQAPGAPLQWRRALGARASCPRTRRQARMPQSVFEPMRLAAHSEGKMPSPPGARPWPYPLVAPRRAAFYGASSWRTPPMATGAGGEGILPSHAPTGAHGQSRLRTNAPCGAWRGQDALAPRGPSVGVSARSSPGVPLSTAQPPGAPLQWRRALGARASCPRTRRQARMAKAVFEPMRLAVHTEGKMPSPRGARPWV